MCFMVLCVRLFAIVDFLVFVLARRWQDGLANLAQHSKLGGELDFHGISSKKVGGGRRG